MSLPLSEVDLTTVLAPVRIEQPSSLRDQVESALAAAIISGEIAPGAVISVPTMALRFDVSATPVREAMLNLEKRGLVEALRNRGFRVTALSRRDLEQIVQVRQLLEPAAMARLAETFAATLGPGDGERLRGLADQIVAGAASGDLVAYLTADQRFHLSLLELLGNPHLTRIVADLRAQTRLTGLTSLIATAQLRESADEHHRLLQLLAAGDGPAAAELMRRHVAHILGWWSGEAEEPA